MLVLDNGAYCKRAAKLTQMMGRKVTIAPHAEDEAVASAARKAVMPSFVDTFKVVAAKLGDDAGVLGCAAWAEKSYASPQTKTGI